MKRTFDVFVSSAGLILLSPLFVAVATMIRLTSPGSVFFRQERIGRGFRPFSAGMSEISQVKGLPLVNCSLSRKLSGFEIRR